MTIIDDEKRKIKRKKILDSAKFLFKNKGFSQTTMLDIAKKSGVAKGTLYLYYKNKSEIILNLLLEFRKEFNTLIQNVVSKESDSGIKLLELENIFKQIALVTLEDLGAYKFIKEFSFKNLDRSKVAETFKDCEISIIKGLRSIIDQGIDEGLIVDSLDSLDVAIFYDTLFDGMVHKLSKFDNMNTYRDLSKKDYVDKVFTVLKKGLKK
ncbi:MAG: hypothetical protein CSA15_12825 [Candidatus Delongbacteria bacterium]|nr:MAG: hypothetical protein CSA15_12825 [Candidatus Delongbacteria bacterium]